MNARSARKFLALHLEDPNESPPPALQKALKALGGSPDLAEDYKRQCEIDRQVSKLFADAIVPDPVEQTLATAVQTLPARRFHPRDPAILAAAIGFLLLLGVLLWNFLGRPAAFPPDAVEIAEKALEFEDEPFDPVGEPAGQVEDWFVMKGFDGFKVPERLASHLAESGGVLKILNTPVAVVTVPLRDARFLVFEAAPFGISLPSGEWRTSRIDDLHAAAIRQENGMCFMILRRGSLESVQDLAGSSGR